MDYLKRSAAAEYLTKAGIEISKSALSRLAMSGKGPEYIIIRRRAYYKAEWLDRWLEDVFRSSSTLAHWSEFYNLEKSQLVNRDLALSPLEGNLLKAVRRWCMDCSGNSGLEVDRCGHTSCPLHPYRFGTSPAQKTLPVNDIKEDA